MRLSLFRNIVFFVCNLAQNTYHKILNIQNFNFFNDVIHLDRWLLSRLLLIDPPNANQIHEKRPKLTKFTKMCLPVNATGDICVTLCLQQGGAQKIFRNFGRFWQFAPLFARQKIATFRKIFV